MTGMEYLTPDGQQLTLDVTACAFLPQKPKLLCPVGGGGLFCHKNQSYSKSPKMDKSQVKNFPHSEGGGGAFLPKF